jgi:predicted permease
MLFLPVVYVGLGLLIGWCTAKVGGAGDDFRRSAIAAVAFGNSTGLPITLLAIIHSQFPKDSDLGATDPLLFLSIYLVPYPVLQWSVGSWLLQPKPQVSERDAQSKNQPHNATATQSQALSLLLKPEQPVNTLVPEGMCLIPRAVQTFDVRDAIGDLAEQGRPHLHSWSHCQDETVLSAARQAGNLRLIPSGGCLPMPSDDSLPRPVSALLSDHELAKPRTSKREVVWTVMRRVFPPPVMAALLGLVVALIEPVRALFVDLVDSNNNSPFEWLFNGIVKLGAAAVPINMLVLGSALAKGARRTISMRLALSVACGKLIIMPAIGLLIIVVGKTFMAGIDDTFFLVVAVLSATPTANNIMVMAELAGENKEGMAACIFAQYMFTPVVLTIWLTVFVSVSTSHAQ